MDFENFLNLNEKSFEFDSMVFKELKRKVIEFDKVVKDFKLSIRSKDNTGLITDAKDLKSIVDDMNNIIKKNSKGNY